MKLIILGAGGYGRTIEDIVEQMHTYEKVSFLDDRGGDERIIGTLSSYEEHKSPDTEFYPAFGNNELRLQWLDRLCGSGCKVATIIHPSAYCSPKAHISEGCAVLPKAIVNTNCRLERGCIINLGAIVDHGSLLEEGVHVCLGAVVKAENRIPRAMKIQAGQVIEDRTYPL